MSGEGEGEGDSDSKVNVSQDVSDYLSEYTLEGKWHAVIDIYNRYPQAHWTMIDDAAGTALHVAVDLNEEEVVGKLVSAIVMHELKGVGELGKKKIKGLEMKDERGDTPLHIAASRGFGRVCKCIIGNEKERIYLLHLRNNLGETPLFLAAVNWKKQAFAYLSHISRDYVTWFDLVRDDGDSILHCAIKREYFDLAVIIVHYYDFLSTYKNDEGFTPLKVLATRPSAFRSASNLSWPQRILYYCIFVERLDPDRAMESALAKMDRRRKPKTIDFPKNYATVCELLFSLKGLARGTDGKKQKDEEKNQASRESLYEIATLRKGYEGYFPPNYDTVKLFVKSAYIHTLGLSGVVELKATKKMKKNHIWCRRLLKELMRRPYAAFTGAGGRPTETDWSVGESDVLNIYSQWKQGISLQSPEMPRIAEASNSTGTPGETSKSQALEEEKKLLSATVSDKGTSYRVDLTKKETEDEEKYDPKETAFLVAARNGIVELVNEILNLIPSAIHNTNSKKENALLVAVMSRQPLVVETLRTRMHDKKEVWNNLLLAVDKDENTLLHLAAQSLSEDKPWQIAGHALQMMWDIKWFEYIKGLVPQHFYFRSNKESKTAGEVFRESHKDLVRDSGEWLKDTSESCSVVAGLVAGVSFAAASSVPGGTIEDTGKPVLEGQPAFDAFAISSLIGLCFSVTALIMFLSILTSRKQAKDFRRDLPLKLLLGLSSLFVSIAAMFVSFCTGHVFLLNGKYRRYILPVYAATCLPVTFYAIAQFPLYADLLDAILIKVPRPSDKGDGL